MADSPPRTRRAVDEPETANTIATNAATAPAKTKPMINPSAVEAEFGQPELVAFDSDQGGVRHHVFHAGWIAENLS
jgi:hypothetical protein